MWRCMPVRERCLLLAVKPGVADAVEMVVLEVVGCDMGASELLRGGGPKTNSGGMASPNVRASFAILRRRSLSESAFFPLDLTMVGVGAVGDVGERVESSYEGVQVPVR
jgi:hypothetical protein